MNKIVIKCKHMGTFKIATEMSLQEFLRENVVGNCIMLNSKKAIPMNDVITIELKEMATKDVSFVNRFLGRE